MKLKSLSLLFTLTLSFQIVTHAQNYFRIEADFSIKEKSTQMDPLLTMGRAYFDRNERTVVFDLRFPEREIVVMNDSLTLRIKNDTVLEAIKTINFIDFTFFNLVLNGDLAYYGLDKTSYTLTNVEKDKGMVISTWQPPDRFKELKGKMLLSQVDKNLNGLISFDTDGGIISKQFFKDYQLVDGLNVPTTVTQILYAGMDEIKKLTTYKNIKINNLQNEEFYRYTIPDY